MIPDRMILHNDVFGAFIFHRIVTKEKGSFDAFSYAETCSFFAKFLQELL